jgi:hypothetical protein
VLVQALSCLIRPDKKKKKKKKKKNRYRRVYTLVEIPLKTLFIYINFATTILYAFLFHPCLATLMNLLVEEQTLHMQSTCNFSHPHSPQKQAMCHDICVHSSHMKYFQTWVYFVILLVFFVRQETLQFEVLSLTTHGRFWCGFKVVKKEKVTKIIVAFQAEVFWVVTPCIFLFGYKSYEVHAASIFTLYLWHGPLKRWYHATTLHGVTTQKTST